jgi:hypothetical protein
MSHPVISVQPLGFPWRTEDPFLFCVHHDDAYPAGNAALGPAAALDGRDLGQDFAGKDGWRMYHGDVVPGFPQHPHRGFETVTVVRRGLIDHSDSLGATARFGHGDAQWLTAGHGIQHCEMFPLVKPDAPNPLELFQLWLNLPAADKRVPAYFSMLWREQIPTHTARDADGRETEVRVVAGALGDARPPAPPPNSWASRPEADLAIWTLKLAPNARWTVPAAKPGTNRSLYFFAGKSLTVAGARVDDHAAIKVEADVPVELVNGPEVSELLLLQGRPIGEPVVQYGPFVMNTREEIMQTMREFQRTGFGGWPWTSPAPVHARDQGRFAKHADGKVEQKSD